MKQQMSLTLRNTKKQRNKAQKVGLNFTLSDSTCSPAFRLHCPERLLGSIDTYPSTTQSHGYSGPTASSLWRKADPLLSRCSHNGWEGQTPVHKLVCATLYRSKASPHCRDQWGRKMEDFEEVAEWESNFYGWGFFGIWRTW